MSRRPSRRSIHLGVDLSATSAKAPVWRTHGSQPAQPFDQETAVRLARIAALGALDLVVFDSSFALRPSRDTPLAGVLDPAIAARRIASVVPEVGVVAQLDPGGIDPAHLAQALAAVDEASGGRAGWQLGRGTPAEVQAVRAELATRPTAAGKDPGEQTVTRDGVRFTVPTPRPGSRARRTEPPVVVVLPQDEASLGPALELAGREADLVRVRVATPRRAAALRERVHEAVRAAGREPKEVRVLVELFAVIGPDRASSAARFELLRHIEGVHVPRDTLVLADSPVHVATEIQDWVDSGAADGFVIRPAALATDLDAFVAGVVPVLQGAGYLRESYPGSTLRETLGLSRRARARSTAVV